LTFPPKTGYIKNTLAHGIQPKTSPECAQYNTTKYQGLQWVVDPDAHCTTVTKTIVQDGKTITVNFSGELFGMNGLYFEHGHQLATLLPDEVYEMTVGFGPHPFHHHINPYQITTIQDNGFTAQVGEWRDVVSLCSGGPVRMRTRDFVGKVVMHCHFLPHEDRGLMGYYNISNGTCNNTQIIVEQLSGVCTKPSPPEFCDNILRKSAIGLGFKFEHAIIFVVGIMIYLVQAV